MLYLDNVLSAVTGQWQLILGLVFMALVIFLPALKAADRAVIPAGHEPYLRLLTRGAERPSDDEVAANPRAASARVRAAERIREAA